MKNKRLFLREKNVNAHGVQMATTIKDIAEYCRVSVGTVDRALNGRTGINEKTKQRILEAAQLLNYHPNYIGQSLARGKTMTIGVVCFDLYNNFFPELIDNIERLAKERGYFIYLILTHRDFRLEEDGLKYLHERLVDGIILFPIGFSKGYIEFLHSLHIPIVTIYNKLGENDFPFVGVDDRQAMEDAVKYLVDKGYTDIAYLTPDITGQEKEGLNTYTLRQRAQGYQDGMRRVGLKGIQTLEKGSMEERLERYLKEHDFREKSAILCLCDSYAIKAMKYLQQRGIRVPEQIGIMGYDDIEQLNYVVPRIATIKYSVPRMGKVAVDLLFRCMEKEECRGEYLLDYTIIDGGSLE